MIESVTLNFGPTPSVAVIKFPVGQTMSGGGVTPSVPALGSVVHLSDFDFSGIVWTTGDADEADGSKWKQITVLDYRTELNSKAIYRIYNLSDERAPRGNIIDENSTLLFYQDTPYTIGEVQTDLESELPTGFFVSGRIIPTFYTPPTGYTASSYDYCPEMRFEFVSFVDAIDALIKAAGGHKWFVKNKTIHFQTASGTPTIPAGDLISSNSQTSMGVSSKGFKVVGSYELKQMTADPCHFLSGTDNISTRKEHITVDGVEVISEEDDSINPILRASIYPALYADTNYPLSEVNQWVGSLLDNPAETPYIEAKLKKLKRGIRFAPVNFTNDEFDNSTDETNTNPKTIKANRLVYYDTGAGYDKVVSTFKESEYIEDKWYRVDANIDHRTGLIEIDYEKLKTISTITFNAGAGPRGSIDFYGNTDENALKSNLSDDTIDIIYEFTASIRATYVYKSQRIQVEVGGSNSRAVLDDRYRKFENYNIAETPGYPIYEGDKVDDTDKMAILANQRMFSDTSITGSSTILIDPSITLDSNGGVAGITHRPQDGLTEIHYSNESLFGMLETLPEDAKRYLKETINRSDEANTKSVSNSQDLRLTDTENRVRKEAERKKMLQPAPHSHSGKRVTVKGQRNSTSV